MKKVNNQSLMELLMQFFAYTFLLIENIYFIVHSLKTNRK